MSSWYTGKKEKKPKTPEAPSFAHDYPGSNIVINIGQDDEEYQRYMKQFEKESKEKEAKEKEEKEVKAKKAEQKAWDDWFKAQFAKYMANEEPSDDDGDVSYSEYMKQWRRHMKETYGSDKPKEVKEKKEETKKDESYKDYMLEWRKKMKKDYGYSTNYPASSKSASSNSSNESLQDKLKYLNLEPEEGGPAYIYAESKVKYGSSSKDKKMKSFEYTYKRGK